MEQPTKDRLHRSALQVLRFLKWVLYSGATGLLVGAVASAFTFDRSPTAAITGQVVPLLSSVEDRAWLMRTCYGIQEVIVSSFDGMMRMDWRDFITQYLVKELGVVHVVAGHDFHFGYMGKGNPQRLRSRNARRNRRKTGSWTNCLGSR